MVGSEIGDNGDVRPRLDSIQHVKLKTADFKHDPVFDGNLIEVRQQAAADVPSQPAA